MKKVISILVFAFLMHIGNTHAQAQFGVKAGLNLSKFGQDIDRDGRTSFHVGAIADIAISDEFHIQPEVMYSGEGSEDLEANFIRIVGVAKYYPVEGFSLEGGPQFGIRASADNAIEDATKGFDFGLALGAGYELVDIGLFFTARYNLGIANLADNDYDFDTNLGTFQLSVGYKFQ